MKSVNINYLFKLLCVGVLPRPKGNNIRFA